MSPFSLRRPLAVPLITLVLAACGSNEPSAGNGQGGSAGTPQGGAAGIGGVSGGDGPGFDEGDANELFSASTLPVFELSLPPDRWDHLRAHARDEEYEPAELRFRGEVVGEVGLRFKGNFGTLTRCFDDAGNLVCRKLSMKLKFDEYEPGRRFFGLKRVNLHSMINDATLLHEKLAYDAFRVMGIAAPRSGWALATVNGEPLGLFSLVEEIDGRFTHDRWPDDGDGDLYKEAWPRSSEPEAYASALETNEAEATNVAFATFAEELQGAEGAAAQREALSRWMDVGELARYMAVDDAIANVDGVTAIYCSADDPSACGNHNYFFYSNEARTSFRLVPWDLDGTMWPQTFYDYVPPWHVTPEDCEDRYAVEGDEVTLEPPGCDPFFRGLAHDMTDYDRALEEVFAGPLSASVAEAAIDRHAALLAEAVAAEPRGQSVERWRSELGILKGNLARLRARAQARRSGLTATELTLSGTGVNDFESVNEAALGLLPVFSNLSTTTQLTLAGAAASPEPALSGERSLLLSFEYRNEGTTPWGQWTNLAFAFRDRPLDLSALTGVRLTLRTDRPRTVRIDLDSPLYEASNEGIKFGWEFAVTSAPLTLELPLQTATLPTWARATRDDLGAIRARVTGLAFQPLCLDRGSSGLLAEGSTDAGLLVMDDIELY